MILELLQLSEIPEWEGLKIGISCFCGGQLKTISSEWQIGPDDSIGEDETVRCQINPDHEFDFDDNERLKCAAQGYSATTAQRICVGA